MHVKKSSWFKANTPIKEFAKTSEGSHMFLGDHITERREKNNGIKVTAQQSGKSPKRFSYAASHLAFCRFQYISLVPSRLGSHLYPPIVEPFQSPIARALGPVALWDNIPQSRSEHHP